MRNTCGSRQIIERNKKGSINVPGKGGGVQRIQRTKGGGEGVVLSEVVHA